MLVILTLGRTNAGFFCPISCSAISMRRHPSRSTTVTPLSLNKAWSAPLPFFSPPPPPDILLAFCNLADRQLRVWVVGFGILVPGYLFEFWVFPAIHRL